MPSKEVAPGIELRSGRYYAGVESYKGSPFVRYEAFTDLDDAIRWREAALAAVDAVKAIPSAEPFRTVECRPDQLNESTSPTVGELVDSYVGWLEDRNLGYRHVVETRRILERYVVSQVGEYEAASLTQNDVRVLRDSVVQRGLTSRVRDLVLRRILHVFRYAQQQSLLDEDTAGWLDDILGPTRRPMRTTHEARGLLRSRVSPGIYVSSGHYVAQVPKSQGSKWNVRRSFRDLEEARAWRAAALAAMRPGSASGITVGDVTWAPPRVDRSDDV